MKNIKEIVAKPRTVALYADMSMDGWYTVFEVNHYTFDETGMPLPEGKTRESSFSGYVRVSEPVSLQFKAIDDDEVIAKAVESLNEEERKTIDELNRKLATIREKKSQLLALTHQS